MFAMVCSVQIRKGVGHISKTVHPTLFKTIFRHLKWSKSNGTVSEFLVVATVVTGN